MAEFAAVMFDMDGLLLDTEQVCLDAFLDARRTFGLPDGVEFFMKCVGLRQEMTRPIILDSLQGQADYDAFAAEWDRRMTARLNTGIPLRPGAADLLRLLHARGLPVGVATSTRTDRARHHLDRAGLLPFLRHVVGGDRVDLPKPDPQPYHRLAALLGATASACIAFEDSETGTRAAIASGAVTVQVPDLIEPSEALCALGHLIAPSLLDGAVAAGLITAADIA
ncbi:HAD family hydrolase [Antarctobacter jejuensis]|uniref:HAD family hydrolase n=1 Tax=Antarctobacter jejuensis TaxID=1439938 RepID=UPI003FD4D205